MPDPEVVIAERLSSGLVHPGDERHKPFPIPLPGMRSTGIPDEMAAQFAQDAGLPDSDAPKLIAEAIVHVLAEAGHTIIPTPELAQLRQDAADAPDGTRVVHVHCRQHHTPLMDLTINKTDQVHIDCTTISRSLGRH